MSIKHISGKVLRLLFPGKMALRDLRRKHTAELKRMQKNVNLSESEWVELIKKQYKASTGRDLNLENPQRFTEKIQWRKLYDHDPLYSRLADKYAVREWIKDKIGEQYLIPLLGVWDRAEDINFRKLPNSFVLKTNNAYNTNIIVKDKRTINQSIVRENLNYWLKIPFWSFKGEMHYKDIKPRIIAEKYMVCEGLNYLPDYKFFCFDGKVFCSRAIIDRTEKPHSGRFGFFDREFNHLPYYREDYQPLEEQIDPPSNYEKMVEIAEILSSGFSHVRVDLYDINGDIYFGEMTFTTSSGGCVFKPDEFDHVLGAMWR